MWEGTTQVLPTLVGVCMNRSGSAGKTGTRINEPNTLRVGGWAGLVVPVGLSVPRLELWSSLPWALAYLQSMCLRPPTPQRDLIS